MLKAFKYRLYPTKDQSILINKHINASRFVYNLALECKKMAWDGYRVNLSCFDLHNQLKDLKSECGWLKEVNSQSLQQSISNLDRAYVAFFKGQSNFPKFKKKSISGSFNIPQYIMLQNEKLIIPKFKSGIKLSLHRPIKGNIKRATISKTTTGKYFVSIICETDEDIKEKAIIEDSTTVGIDLGIKTYIVMSNGKEIENPKFLQKSMSRLKYVHRKYSKHKGKRTKQKLAILHEKIANQRKDFLHKISTELMRDNQSIAVETLHVSNMLKNRSLSRSISDAGWYTFVMMLEYKAGWYGKNILRIGSFEPTSKCHASCGYINKDLSLKDREWLCPKCGEIVYRDLNAAINIKSFALKYVLSGTDKENQGELPTQVGARTLEANSIASAMDGSSQSDSIRS